MNTPGRVLTVLLVAVIGCGDPTKPPSRTEIDRLELIDGDDQRGTVATTLPKPITVKAHAVGGGPAEGIPISFRASGFGTVSPTRVETDAAGLASAAWTLGESTFFHQSATATAGAYAIQFVAQSDPGPPAQLERSSPWAEAQRGVVSEQLDLTLGASVSDEYGNSIAEQRVDFSVALGDGTLSPPDTVTDEFGWARVRWTLGPLAGRQTVHATVEGLEGPPLEYTALGLAAVGSTLEKSGGDAQLDTIDATLAEQIEIVVRDSASGQPLNGIPVIFMPAEGSGMVTGDSVTDAGGLARAEWTLGSTAGPQRVLVEVLTQNEPVAVFAAEASAGAPVSATGASGDGQYGLLGLPLRDTIVVQVEDRHGNPVQGHPVSFSVTDGGGDVSPEAGLTELDGGARAVWTMGGGVEGQRLVATAEGLEDSPVVFRASAVGLDLTSVSPSELTEGDTVTLSGTFQGIPTDEATVLIDGVRTTTLSASVSEVVFTVPAFDCRPDRPASVQFGVGNAFSDSLAVRITPRTTQQLATGDWIVLGASEGHCLSLDAGGVDEEYLVGVHRLSGTTINLAVVGREGISPRSVPSASVRSLTRSTSMPAGGGPATLGDGHAMAELRMRVRDRAMLEGFPLPTLRSGMASGPARAPLTEGETIEVRIPDIEDDPCHDFIPVTALVRHVGRHSIILTDIDNPQDDPLTMDDIQDVADVFDRFIFPVDTTYFGAPGDVDANGGVIILLSVRVNAFREYAGFVSPWDLVPRSECEASSEGEIFYGRVPDPSNISGGGPVTRSSVVEFLPPLMAHEFAHTIQVSRRAALDGDVMELWEAEGLAEIATEAVGHAITGNSVGLDYGSVTMNDGFRWYHARFSRLGRYFGWDGDAGRIAEAPNRCSIFEDGACENPSFYGASWSFARYLGDRFGAGYGGEELLFRDWVSRFPERDGVRTVESLLGTDFERLMAEWGAALYTDGRLVGADPALSFSSWDLADIFDSFNPETRLSPRSLAFEEFEEWVSMKAGGTGYYLLSDPGTRSAFSLKLRFVSGNQLPNDETGLLWVVRIR